MKTRKHILIIIVIILIGVFIFSAYNLIKILIDYNSAISLYEDMQNQYVESATTRTSIEETTFNTKLTENKEISDQPPISVNFNELLSENEEVVAWLYSENTPINYPVVQTDDNESYLHSDLNGNYLINGTLFVDFRNQQIEKDLNYIIYGHSMNNQSMFGSLLNYKNQKYYDEHKTMYFLTPNKNYRIDLIAGAVVSPNDSIYQISPSSQYLNELCFNSTFKSDTSYQSGDNTITLSTCSYENNNVRYVVIGKFVAI